MTPDGTLLVDIHAISHTNRGKDSRGRWLQDRWDLWYWLTSKNGNQVEKCKRFYYEVHKPFAEAGWDIWPYGERIELDPPIPVVIEVKGDKYVVTHVEKRKDTIHV